MKFPTHKARRFPRQCTARECQEGLGPLTISRGPLVSPLWVQ